MNIKVRIMNLVNRAQASQKALHDNTHGDFGKWAAEQSNLDKELQAIDKAAGPGLVVGRCLSFGVGDGGASYLVTKVRKNDVVVEWVPTGDGYFSDAVWLSPDKRHYIVSRDAAERQVKFSDLHPKKIILNYELDPNHYCSCVDSMFDVIHPFTLPCRKDSQDIG